MARILLFGSNDIFGVPENVTEWIKEYAKQGHEFIVGDRKGAESSFHQLISSIGALNQTTVYCTDSPKNNLFEIKTRAFVTYYNEDTKTATVCLKGTSDNSIDTSFPEVKIEDIEKEADIVHNKQWYEFRDRQLINDCDIGICLYNGESKGTLHMIQLMNIKEKPCYTFTFG